MLASRLAVGCPLRSTLVKSRGRECIALSGSGAAAGFVAFTPGFPRMEAVLLFVPLAGEARMVELDAAVIIGTCTILTAGLEAYEGCRGRRKIRRSKELRLSSSNVRISPSERQQIDVGICPAPSWSTSQTRTKCMRTDFGAQDYIRRGDSYLDEAFIVVRSRIVVVVVLLMVVVEGR